MSYQPGMVSESDFVTALAGKANASTVGGLATAVASKASQSDLSALSTTVAGKANAADVPVASTQTPMSEAVAGAVGDDAHKFVQQGHQHPRVSSVIYGTTAANGRATITFTRSFSAKPGMVYAEEGGSAADAAQPAIFKTESWVMTGANYTGCVVRGWRSQAIPQNLVSLLIGAVFNLFGATASGISFSAVAIARSDA